MKKVDIASNSTLTLHVGISISVKMQAGQHYQVRKPGKAGDPNDLQTPNNRIATRQGDTLHLRYSAGSTADFEDFYRLCKDASECNVNVASDTDAGITLGAQEASGGITKADGGTLVYAHGSHDVLMIMAQDQAQLLHTFGTLGDAAALTYLPQLAEVGLFAAFAAEGFNLASATSAPALTSTLLGIVQGGPVIAGNDLKASICAADGGTVIAQNVVVDSSGHFTANLGSYSGVLIVKLLNTGSANDYLDEATNAGKNLNTVLTAAGILSPAGSTLSMNVNALTTIAYNLLGADHSITHVNAVNAAVAQALGLTQLHGTAGVTTNGGSYNPTDGLSEGEKYGAILAALSGMDKLNGGDLQTTLDQLGGTSNFLVQQRPRHGVAGLEQGQIGQKGVLGLQLVDQISFQCRALLC
jgi:hypothetical protein